MRKINKIVVAGAGTMGSAIAQTFAENGYSVSIYDSFREALIRSEGAMDEKVRGKIEYTSSEECFRDCDLVVESIIENLEIKQDCWSMIEALAPADCLFTTNTSGLSINAISQRLADKSRFAGMHWFNPAHIVPLIEIIAGTDTTAEMLDTIYELALKIGKKPVVCQKDVPGFLANRIQFAVLREAMHLMELGAARPQDIDQVMKYGLGFRYAALGPFEIADMGGLDVFYHISSYLNAELCNEQDVQEPLKAAYEKGDFGVKSGRGFYDYSGDRAKEAIETRDRVFHGILSAAHHD